MDGAPTLLIPPPERDFDVLSLGLDLSLRRIQLSRIVPRVPERWRKSPQAVVCYGSKGAVVDQPSSKYSGRGVTKVYL